MKKLALIVLLFACVEHLEASINAKLMRYMDVSKTQIAFVYGGDIWLVPIEGGVAVQVTHSPGEESWPKFSPDGQTLAFSASYHGNQDVYTMPITGGVPHRVTYQSFADRTIDWHPDGERILFASARSLGQRRSRQFFLVHKNGGLPEKLDIPYGELASFSPDGNRLAYITKITENYPFKRYRGGLASDILIYDFTARSVVNITDNPANDGKPAWASNKLYYLSDQGRHFRRNIWAYDFATKAQTQITKFTDFDITFLSAGPYHLVFEEGGILHLMDLATEKHRKIEVQVVSDLSVEMPKKKKVSNQIASVTPSPDGKRMVFEARGELFDVPAKEGYSKNLTRSSGAFDYSPAWSPDGRHIAYWSDRDGEYQIYLYSYEGDEVHKISNRDYGFGYTLHWSPNGKQLAYVDERNDIIVQHIDGDSRVIDNLDWNHTHPGKFRYRIAWSPDSKYITYAKNGENAHGGIHIYSMIDDTVYQMTSYHYDDASPVFTKDGKYLLFATNRKYQATYSDMGDGTWIYPNATQIASLALTSEIPSLLQSYNDTITIRKEKSKKDMEAAGGDEMNQEEKSDNGEQQEDSEISIDIADAEARVVLLPPAAGNLGQIFPFKDKFTYIRYPNTGSGEKGATLMIYDFKKTEEKKVLADVESIVSTGNGRQLLVKSKGKFGIIKPMANQKIDKPVQLDGLVMDLIPKQEWHQIVLDTWRRHRDFFYDPNMHGVDWEALKTRYFALVDDARTRWDVTNIQSNLVAELSAGHTYSRGGDVERLEPVENGYLGIDWTQDDEGYRVDRIIKPALWDTEVRSPFDRTGVQVKEGDYILSVNGMILDLAKDPYAAFEGLAGKVVSLRVKTPGVDQGPHEVIVKTLNQREEQKLRYLAWIEHNRLMVEELSDGKLGYVYMSNTGGQGQLELVQMYYGQLAKKGFIIDERFNSGGQLSDRFLEMLQRPVLYNQHWRHGRDHTWPIKANQGPMGMLINGWAGSGGDGFPWGFQELEAGPIVGERTLGTLVGPATRHKLIDGGSITVPGARLYDNDGHWFWEGEGVTPDIEVWDDPNLLMQGRDPQIERVVAEVMKMIEEQPFIPTPAPPLEDRTAKGLR
ncbi:MAG: Tricorn protease like protein [Saprospiraceae bacterium]|nr:Tricorn protease like protein [Saprospiraceae bacterium]